MIEEKIIIHLQAIASFFMCFEYFLTERYKEGIEYHLKQRVISIKDGASRSIRLQNKVFFESRPLLMIGGLSVATYYGCLALLGALSSSGTSPYIVLIIALIGMTSVLGFVELIKGFLKGVLPYGLPVLVRGAAGFLLYCPKGVIGGIGILFLIASFICRYINVYA